MALLHNHLYAILLLTTDILKSIILFAFHLDLEWNASSNFHKNTVKCAHYWY